MSTQDIAISMQLLEINTLYNNVSRRLLFLPSLKLFHPSSSSFGQSTRLNQAEDSSALLNTQLQHSYGLWMHNIARKNCQKLRQPGYLLIYNGK
jgi:hypothetical protein